MPEIVEREAEKLPDKKLETVEMIKDAIDDLCKRCLQPENLDSELAHILEDAIWMQTLYAIACGAKNPTHLAKAALTTNGLKFNRWYA